MLFCSDFWKTADKICISKQCWRTCKCLFRNTKRSTPWWDSLWSGHSSQWNLILTSIQRICTQWKEVWILCLHKTHKDLFGHICLFSRICFCRFHLPFNFIILLRILLRFLMIRYDLNLLFWEYGIQIAFYNLIHQNYHFLEKL